MKNGGKITGNKAVMGDMDQNPKTVPVNKGKLYVKFTGFYKNKPLFILSSLLIIACGLIFVTAIFGDVLDGNNNTLSAYNRENFDNQAKNKEAQNNTAKSADIAKEDAKLDPEASKTSVNAELESARYAAAKNDFAKAAERTNIYIANMNGDVQYTVYIELGLYYKRLNNNVAAKVSYEKAADLLKKDNSIGPDDKQAALVGIELSVEGL